MPCDGAWPPSESNVFASGSRMVCRPDTTHSLVSTAPPLQVAICTMNDAWRPSFLGFSKYRADLTLVESYAAESASVFWYGTLI